MKTLKLFKALFMTAFVLSIGWGFTGCIENDDEQLGDVPEMTLSTKTLNFTQAPTEAKSFNIDMTGDGYWQITVAEGDADAIDIQPMEGKSSAEVHVLPSATNTARQIKLNVALHGLLVGRDVKLYSYDVMVNQTADGAEIDTDPLYYDDFDGEPATQTFGTSGTSWPYIDQFTAYKNAVGKAAENVEYSGSGMSIRNNSNSNSSYSDIANASGVNNLFFGANASFIVSGLKLAANENNLRMQFASEKYSQTLGSVFLTSEFHIYLSKDGEKWAEVKDYVFHGGTTEGRWNLAEAFFTLKEVPETLYLKFTADAASAYRMDDLALYVNLTGTNGQEIDLDNASAGGDTPGGNTPGGDDSNLTGYEASSAFTVTEDNSNDGAYTLGTESTVNGQPATGIKFGTGTKAGVYTSPAVGEAGEKYLTFYGFAWNKAEATIYIRVNGGGTIESTTNYGFSTYAASSETSVALKSNSGVAGNAPFTITDVTESDYYSFKISGMTATSTITLSTSPKYDTSASDTGNRAILTRIRLTDTDDKGDVEGGDQPGTDPTPGDAVTMTIPEIIAACEKSGSEQTVLNASKDVVFEAVVVTDKAGGNWSSNNMAVMTPNSTDPKNGILLYGSGITNPGDASYNFEPGEKVKVTLKAGQARVTVYSDCNEVTGSAGADWIAIEKTGEKVEIKPVELTTVANLKAYQYMPVTVKNVTSPASGTWKDTVTFKVGSENLTVYTASGATFVSKAFIYNKTADLSGMVTLYKGAVQLAPRNDDDIKAFMEGGTTEPDPTPGGDKGTYESDDIFIYGSAGSGDSCTALGESTVNGEKASGVKMGTGSKVGTFTSGAVGVTGDYTLSLYGFAWNNAAGTVKISVVGGGSVEGTDTFQLRQTAGVTGNPPFTITGVTESDLYTVSLKNLTATSTIKFETVANAYRVVLTGIRLTEGAGGGTTDPDPGTDPTPGEGNKVVFSELGYGNATDVTEVKFGDITLTFDKAAGSNAPKYYDSGTSVRMYANNTVTLDAGNKTITGIKFTYGPTVSATFTPDTGTLTDDTWTGSASKVVFTAGNSGQRHLQAVEVFMEGAAPDPGTDPTPTENPFESDERFVYGGAGTTAVVQAYSLESTNGSSTFNGQTATGFKLGSSSAAGEFISAPIGAAGDYTLTLYAVAWKGGKGTLEVSVNNGGSVDGTNSVNCAANDGATSNAPYTVTVTDSDFYTFNLKGLTANSTVSFKSVSGATRVIVAGVHLASAGGGTAPTPEPTVVTFDLATIKAAVADFPANAYGSQNVSSESTWAAWDVDGITFKGARICEATSGNYGGSIQMQGNASDATKQGFFGNTTGGKKITKIVIETLNDTYSPTFNVYLSNSAAMPSSSSKDAVYNAGTCSDAGVAYGSTKLYTTTIDVTGDYTYFALRNDKTGANYVKSVTITLE